LKLETKEASLREGMSTIANYEQLPVEFRRYNDAANTIDKLQHQLASLAQKSMNSSEVHQILNAIRRAIDPAMEEGAVWASVKRFIQSHVDGCQESYCWLPSPGVKCHHKDNCKVLSASASLIISQINN